MSEISAAPDVQRLVGTLHAVVREAGCTVAVCESLTGGQLASALAAGVDAAEWFRGGIVAYQPEVKHGLLEAPGGPVVTAETADAMAASAARLLEADFTVATTGVGGPDAEEGHSAGTVYVGTSTRGGAAHAELHRFVGDPDEVLHQALAAALDALIFRVRQETGC